MLHTDTQTDAARMETEQYFEILKQIAQDEAHHRRSDQRNPAVALTSYAEEVKAFVNRYSYAGLTTDEIKAKQEECMRRACST